MLKPLLRNISHIVFQPRRFNHKCMVRLAGKTRDKKILELASGKLHKGEYYYSVKNYFESNNEFIQSDIKEEYGHRIIDATTMEFKDEFDIVLCMNLLEHVYDFQLAVSNIYEALKNNGMAVIIVPVFYPLHDEPYDFWRFTEHSLRKILHRFSINRIQCHGIRQYPFAYYVEAIKRD